MRSTCFISQARMGKDKERVEKEMRKKKKRSRQRSKRQGIMTITSELHSFQLNDLTFLFVFYLDQVWEIGIRDRNRVVREEREKRKLRFTNHGGSGGLLMRVDCLGAETRIERKGRGGTDVCRARV